MGLSRSMTHHMGHFMGDDKGYSAFIADAGVVGAEQQIGLPAFPQMMAVINCCCENCAFEAPLHPPGSKRCQPISVKIMLACLLQGF